jgi:hypothetical protein
MSIDSRIQPLPAALFVCSTGAILALLPTLSTLADRTRFAALTVLLLSYLLLEVGRLRRVHPNRWLLNPVVFCSLMTFVMGYGITNVLFILPLDVLDLVGLVPVVTPDMVKLMWLALLGAVAMWLGYWSPIAARFSRPRATSMFCARFLPQTNLLKPFALPMLVIVASGARLIQLRLGIFGYASNYDRLVEMGAITQYLFMASELGKLALVLAALQYYTGSTRRRARGWLYGLLAVEVYVGCVSGFKSAAVMPFIIVALCQYLRTGRVSKQWVIFAIAGIAAAYAVIEPFRAALNSEDPTLRGTSATALTTTMVGTIGTADEATAPLLLSIASRMNLSYIGSFGIAYSDYHSVLPDGSPHFLADIFLSPLHAAIPRLLWASKPLGDLGLWYNQVVMGESHFSSTAMGPFVYLYFAGGYVAVVLGFFLIGIVQRGLFFLLQPESSTPGAVVFLAMLATVGVIDSAFNGLLIALFRTLPLLLLLQSLLFRGRGIAHCHAVALNK